MLTSFIFMISVIVFCFFLIFLYKNTIPLVRPFLNKEFIYISIILGLLFIGFSGAFLCVKTQSESENRNLAKVPVFSELTIENYSESIESYINDHFGMREQWVKLYNIFKKTFFKDPITDDVIEGKNDWYFSKNNIDSVNNINITQDGIDNFVERLSVYQNYLSRKNINLYIVVMPAKFFVYSEFLPKWIKTDRSKVESFIKTVKKDTSIPILDLINPIMQEKEESKYDLYWKTDSHWNPLGASIGLDYIKKFINKNIPDKSHFISHTYEYGLFEKYTDLNRMMGVLDKTEINYSPIGITGYRIKSSLDLWKYYHLKENVTQWKTVKENLTTNNISSIIPLIFCDSYIIGNTNKLVELTFKKSYIGHYEERFEAEDYILKKDETVNTVILSFVDKNLHHFMEHVSLPYSKEEESHVSIITPTGNSTITYIPELKFNEVLLPGNDDRVLFIGNGAISNDTEESVSISLELLEGKSEDLRVAFDRHDSNTKYEGKGMLLSNIENPSMFTITHSFSNDHKGKRVTFVNKGISPIKLYIKSIKFGN